MINIIEKEFKSALLVRKWIDHWFWGKYGVNPYNGCEFACLYCDSRSEKYRLQEDFGGTVIVKKGLMEMLSKRLRNARTLKKDVIGFGSACDPYQPAEAKYRLSRGCLEIFERMDYPVHIITKSTLVLRDLDLLSSIAEKSWCTVSFTITSADDQLGRFLEPRAPNSSLRFKALEKIKTHNPKIQSGVLLMPLVPGVTDTHENLSGMMRKARESGADYVLFGGGATMRDRQALFLLNILKKERPETIPLLEKIYHFQYNRDFYSGAYQADDAYQKRVTDQILELSEKYKLPLRIRRYLPDDYRHENYRVSERLFNESYYRQIKGMPWQSLFWAAQNIQSLPEDVAGLIERNALGTIRGIGGKLEQFILDVYQRSPLKS